MVSDYTFAQSFTHMDCQIEAQIKGTKTMTATQQTKLVLTIRHSTNAAT